MQTGLEAPPLEGGPDEETLTYGYNSAGQIISLTGDQGGTVNNYLNFADYNEDGNIALMVYGNNVYQDYTYRSDNRLLEEINGGYPYSGDPANPSSHASHVYLQKLSYQYDENLNVTDIVDATPGRNFSRNYTYDDLDRLKCIRSMITEKGMNLQGIKRIMALIPCWEFKGGLDEHCLNCPAYYEANGPCWSISNVGEKCKLEDCRSCHVYKINMTCSKLKDGISSSRNWRANSML